MSGGLTPPLKGACAALGTLGDTSDVCQLLSSAVFLQVQQRQSGGVVESFDSASGDGERLQHQIGRVDCVVGNAPGVLQGLERSLQVLADQLERFGFGFRLSVHSFDFRFVPPERMCFIPRGARSFVPRCRRGFVLFRAGEGSFCSSGSVRLQVSGSKNGADCERGEHSGDRPAID